MNLDLSNKHPQKHFLTKFDRKKKVTVHTF